MTPCTSSIRANEAARCGRYAALRVLTFHDLQRFHIRAASRPTHRTIHLHKSPVIQRPFCPFSRAPRASLRTRQGPGGRRPAECSATFSAKSESRHFFSVYFHLIRNNSRLLSSQFLLYHQCDAYISLTKEARHLLPGQIHMAKSGVGPRIGTVEEHDLIAGIQNDIAKVCCDLRVVPWNALPDAYDAKL